MKYHVLDRRFDRMVERAALPEDEEREDEILSTFFDLLARRRRP